jgi:hypothetical protein
LGHEFRDALSALLSPVRVPADSYVAMDYNLNWLAAALMWSTKEVDKEDPRICDATKGVELSDNSDTDLLIAFARGPETHVVLLEAKGYTRWDSAQLRRKVRRLTTIFGEDGNRFSGIVPYWIFVSPASSPPLEAPLWMLEPGKSRVRHLTLPQPATQKVAVGHCDAQGKRKSGGYWQIRRDPWPGRSN